MASSVRLTREAQALFLAPPGSTLPPRSLFATLLLLVWRDLALAAALYIFEVGCTLVTPVAIFELLTWIDSPAPDWRVGFGYLCTLGAAASLAFLSDFVSEHYSKRAGTRSRVAACGLLYEHVLSLPTVHLQQTSTGEMQNLFAVEANALMDLWHGMNCLILQPVEIVGMIGLLYWVVQEAAFGGLFVLAVALAVAHYCGGHVEALARQRAEAADVRTRDTYEMLLGMKVVKMNGWESRFAAEIRTARAAETALTRRMGGFLAVLNSTSNNSIDVISLAVILVFTLGLRRTLTPAIVFTYWVLLGLLHSRIFHFAPALKHVKDGMIAVKRLQSFLRRSVTTRSDILRELSHDAPPPAAVIQMQAASFSWHAGDDTSSSVLRDVTLSVPAGNLTVVAGVIGSAKSTLLQSLLGETHAVAGSARMFLRNRVRGVAYVPQQAWILPGCVRDNIVFGREFNAARYDAVVRACALDGDFAEWRDGDMSSVASFTLSGGQKQRISLARAAYADAEVYLLDDCLSALDQRVAKHVLTQCVCGLLRDKTRLLVTNAAAAAGMANQLVIMVPLAASNEEVTRVTRSSDDEEGDGGSFTAVCGTVQDIQAHPVAGKMLEQLMANVTVSVDDVVVAAPPSRRASTSGDARSRRASALHAPIVDPVLAAARAAVADASVNMPVRGVGGVRGDDAREAVSAHAPLARIMSSAVLPVAGAQPAGAVPGSPASLKRTAQLPFFMSWYHGAGGLPMMWGLALFLLLEVAGVEVGVYWLALWSDDAQERRASYSTYMWGYVGCVIAELCGVYFRQHFYVCGTATSADALHEALLYRVTHAPMSFFDSTSVSTCLQWFGRDINHLDRDTYYASEYFWAGVAYGVLIILLQLIVTPWILLPAALVVVIMAYVLREGAPAGQPDDVDVKRESVASSLPSTPSRAQLLATPNTPAADETPAMRGRPTRCGYKQLSRALEDEHAAKAPLVDHFSRSLEGLVCIRAFGAQARFIADHHALMDTHAAALLELAASSAWQLLRGNLIGCLYYVTSVGIVVPLRIVGGSEAISAAGAGFVVVNSCFSSAMTNLIIEHRGNLLSLAYTRSRLMQRIMQIPQEVSVYDDAASVREHVRIQRDLGPYYHAMMHPSLCATLLSCGCSSTHVGDSSNTPPQRVVAHSSVPADWPSRGRIQLRTLNIRYRADLPLVLKGISLTFAPGSRIGIVGRTGSGKSTILSALLRLVEATSGCIIIDDVDVRDVPLSTLRGRMTVISQDPLFFAASLRRNLDPFREHEDAQLIHALSRVRLLEFATAQAALTGGATPLDMPIAERGSNLSVGQQQCLAIARALLRRPHVCLIDEATANVDPDTEEMILERVRSAFPDVTTIQIAHRLVSVIDCDRVIVLQAGVVMEDAHPFELMQRPGGSFASMVAALPAAQQSALLAAAKVSYESDRQAQRERE